MTPLTLVRDTADDQLIRQINLEHDQAQHAWTQAREHAIRCGELLQQARMATDHGDWAAWLATNFAGSHRTARTYMQLARAVADRPDLLDSLPDDTITTAIETIAEPKPAPIRPAPTPEPESTEPTFTLTLSQISDLVRAFGGQVSEDRIVRWIERLTEPKMIACPDCHAPVMQVIVKGETILADREAWLEQVLCTKCRQTRNAHPDSYVNCAHCNDTGILGTKKRPPGRMLAVDIAWGDEPHVRIIGERTDRRPGEALHPLHHCATEAAA